MASIVSSIVISKFLQCTILENFNLKWTRIQRGVDLGCCWMLFFLLRRVCWPALEECYAAVMNFEDFKTSVYVSEIAPQRRSPELKFVARTVTVADGLSSDVH
jgi:hypothetical protein